MFILIKGLDTIYKIIRLGSNKSISLFQIGISAFTQSRVPLPLV